MTIWMTCEQIFRHNRKVGKSPRETGISKCVCTLFSVWLEYPLLYHILYYDVLHFLFCRFTAAVAVNGAQEKSRAVLHIHAAIFGGTMLSVLHFVASLPRTCWAIVRSLNMMYAADLPRSLHIADLMNRKLLSQEQPASDQKATGTARKNDCSIWR